MASERKYTVAEIDRMRQGLRWKRRLTGEPYRPSELNAEAEDQLRTYMLNGTDPDELAEVLGVRIQGLINTESKTA